MNDIQSSDLKTKLTELHGALSRVDQNNEDGIFNCVNTDDRTLKDLFATFNLFVEHRTFIKGIKDSGRQRVRFNHRFDHCGLKEEFKIAVKIVKILCEQQNDPPTNIDDLVNTGYQSKVYLKKYGANICLNIAAFTFVPSIAILHGLTVERAVQIPSLMMVIMIATSVALVSILCYFSLNYLIDLDAAALKGLERYHQQRSVKGLERYHQRSVEELAALPSQLGQQDGVPSPAPHSRGDRVEIDKKLKSQ